MMHIVPGYDDAGIMLAKSSLSLFSYHLKIEFEDVVVRAPRHQIIEIIKPCSIKISISSLLRSCL